MTKRTPVGDYVPGLALTLCVAALGMVCAQWTGYSSVLVTLVIGLFFNPLVDRPTVKPRVEPGLGLSLGWPFQIGAGLLGLKITSNLLQLLNLGVVAVILSGVFLTIFVSWCANRFVRWQPLEAVMTGASVAICGASALLVLSSVLKKGRLSQESLITLIVTVIGISAIAMLVYPLVVVALGFDDATSALIMGATIHQISQVVGAGAAFGEDGMAIAMMSKMLRIACLVPVTLLFVWYYARTEGDAGQKVNVFKKLPMFLWLFVGFAILNIAGVVPVVVKPTLAFISQGLILLAVAAISVKTNVRALLGVGWRPLVLMGIDSVFLLGWVVVGLSVLS